MELSEFLEHSNSMYVSVIGMRVTHRCVFIRVHKSKSPFSGVGIGFRGVTSFEGELLRAGPHQFVIEKALNSGSDGEQIGELWCFKSLDNRFKIISKEMCLTDKT